MFGWSCSFVGSSIGKKFLMGISGLLLCGFLIMHLLGNLLLFKGAEAFNSYGHALISNPLALVGELILLSLFLFHIVMGITLTMQNEKARDQDYVMKVRNGRGATFASSTMPYTGVIVLIFLVSHVVQFRFGPHYEIVHHGVPMRDLYRLVVEVFSKPGWSLWYVFSVLALGIHVSHGFASAFQSLGLRHPRYTPMIQCLSKIYALIITIGFSSLPIWFYFKGGF